MKYAYVTALTNERYLPGAIALARSLREVKSKYDLAVMIPKEKEDSLVSAIQEYGLLDIPGTYLLLKDGVFEKKTKYAEMIVEQKYDYWRDTFFKLQAASCVDLDKIILLDCDQMVVKNIDHLFEKTSFTATSCGRCVHPDWCSLSSGLLVLEPSEDLHAKLISLIVPAIQLKEEKNMQAGDQDVFNLYFPEWDNHLELYIPEKYNICWGWIADLCEKDKIKPRDFYMIHFPGKEKPWDFSRFFYIKDFISCVLHRKWKKLLYRTYIWRKYRLLCEKN